MSADTNVNAMENALIERVIETMPVLLPFSQDGSVMPQDTGGRERGPGNTHTHTTRRSIPQCGSLRIAFTISAGRDTQG